MKSWVMQEGAPSRMSIYIPREWFYFVKQGRDVTLSRWNAFKKQKRVGERHERLQCADSWREQGEEDILATGFTPVVACAPLFPIRSFRKTFAFLSLSPQEASPSIGMFCGKPVFPTLNPPTSFQWVFLLHSFTVSTYLFAFNFHLQKTLDILMSKYIEMLSNIVKR